MLIHGECHCGAIAYEADSDPTRVTICHCTDCQRLTGSAYRVTLSVPLDDFRLVRGHPAVYVKTGDSGAKRVQGFCSNCGSSLYTHAAEAPTRYGLRVGCIAERAMLVPTRRVWCDSALAWSEDLRGIPGAPRE